MTSSAPINNSATSSPPSDEIPDPVLTPYRRTQALVILASAACFAIFWQAGKWLHIPVERGFDGSLMRQPHWAMDVLAVYVLLACAVLIGTIVSGRSWFFGGLFSAVVGLVALSSRGGGMHYVLFHAAATDGIGRVFIQLAFEQILIFIPIALVWTALWRRYETTADLPDTEAEKKTSPLSTCLAVIVQAAVMAVAVLLLTPTDAKKQVLISVFLGAFAGSSLADYLVPDRKAPGWFWIAPLAVGVIGYLLAHLNSTGFTTGSPEGLFAALARPLPLDYASAGCAGALIGYWVGGDRPDLALSLFAGLATGTVIVRRRRRVASQPSAKQASAKQD